MDGPKRGPPIGTTLNMICSKVASAASSWKTSQFSHETHWQKGWDTFFVQYQFLRSSRTEKVREEIESASFLLAS